MKNTCPKCDTAYNVSASVIGRKFTCKNCNTPVVVTADGLDYQNPPAKAPPPPPAASPEAAFDFDAGGDEEEEPKPAKTKAAKAKRPRDDDDEQEEKWKKKKKSAEPEDDEFDDAPKRKSRRGSGDKSLIKDFLFFREFIAPLVVKFVFVFALLVIVLLGVIGLGGAVLSGSIGAILGALVSLVILVPLMMLATRVYAELILLGFAFYDRLGEIKALLEQLKPPTPPEPPAP